jgi:hypothetical protein
MARWGKNSRFLPLTMLKYRTGTETKTRRGHAGR